MRNSSTKGRFRQITDSAKRSRQKRVLKITDSSVWDDARHWVSENANRNTSPEATTGSAFGRCVRIWTPHSRPDRPGLRKRESRNFAKNFNYLSA